jgi:hypothetical protein
MKYLTNLKSKCLKVWSLSKKNSRKHLTILKWWLEVSVCMIILRNISSMLTTLTTWRQNFKKVLKWLESSISVNFWLEKRLVTTADFNRCKRTSSPTWICGEQLALGLLVQRVGWKIPGKKLFQTKLILLLKTVWNLLVKLTDSSKIAISQRFSKLRKRWRHKLTSLSLLCHLL